MNLFKYFTLEERYKRIKTKYLKSKGLIETDESSEILPLAEELELVYSKYLELKEKFDLQTFEQYGKENESLIKEALDDLPTKPSTKMKSNIPPPVSGDSMTRMAVQGTPNLKVETKNN